MLGFREHDVLLALTATNVESVGIEQASMIVDLNQVVFLFLISDITNEA